MTYGVLGPLALPLGLGCLRLGTEGRPDEASAIALIHHALDAGVRVLDTADSYCLDDKDLHYGERLVAKALAGWGGPRAEVRVVTKVGMARPKGRWVPAARPERLRKEVDKAVAALGGPIFLLMLHGNDPSVPFEDQLAALAALQRAGKVVHLGLCNIDVAEVRQAQRHFEVAAIQKELS
ncbi:MAG: aldo/keto reductase, partial [Myxococcota bacterium]